MYTKEKNLMFIVRSHPQQDLFCVVAIGHRLFLLPPSPFLLRVLSVPLLFCLRCFVSAGSVARHDMT
jgi:hypothetical protein